MGCSSCGTGKPNGCKSNGGCSTGGCNRLNVHDWLANLPFSDPESGCRIIEVSFNRGSRKDFYRNATTQLFDKGDLISVEGVSGFDVGEVSMTGELVRLQMKKKGVDEKNPEIRITPASRTMGCPARVTIQLPTRLKKPERRTWATMIIIPRRSAIASTSMAQYASSSDSNPVASIRLAPRSAAPARSRCEPGSLPMAMTA